MGKGDKAVNNTDPIKLSSSNKIKKNKKNEWGNNNFTCDIGKGQMG
jgi:hypothetical protein